MVCWGEGDVLGSWVVLVIIYVNTVLAIDIVVTVGELYKEKSLSGNDYK